MGDIWEVMQHNPRVVERYPSMGRLMGIDSYQDNNEDIDLSNYKSEYHLPNDKFNNLININVIFAEDPHINELIDLLNEFNSLPEENKKLLKNIKLTFFEYIQKQITTNNLVGFITGFLSHLLILKRNIESIPYNQLFERIKIHIDFILVYILNILFREKNLVSFTSVRSLNILPIKFKPSNIVINNMLFSILYNSISETYPNIFNVPGGEIKAEIIKNIVKNVERYEVKLKPSFVMKSLSSKKLLKSYSKRYP